MKFTNHQRSLLLDFCNTPTVVMVMLEVVGRKSTLMILVLVTIHNWHLHYLKVNNAFLHGALNGDVYMTIPQGVSCNKGNQTCKLLKSLYNIKQVSHK
ncbi:Copia protein, partial [Mucuna pruriens]